MKRSQNTREEFRLDGQMLTPPELDPPAMRRAQLNTVDILLESGAGEDEVRGILGMLGLRKKTGLEVHDAHGQRVSP